MLRWAMAIGAVILLASCAEQDCTKDSDCGPGELCKGGECRPAGGPGADQEQDGGADADASHDAEARPEQGACSPGERLGLCTICGADGRPATADDDATCPTLDCGVYDAYQRTPVGEDTVCYWISHSPATGRCLAMGSCRASVDEAYCGAEQGSVAARAEGECRTLVGCAGTDVPPEVQARPSGTPCDGGAGECWLDGECSPYVGCTHFEATEICESGTEPRGNYCDLYVDRTEIFDCNTYCKENGSTCIDSWNDVAGDCEKGNYEGCAGHTLRNQICRCRR